MIIKHSSIKLEEFNECPGKQSVLDFFSSNGILFDVVNLEKSYWQNVEDTLVISMSKKDIDGILKFLIYFNSQDETHFISRKDKVYFRLWWD